jgi:hypothetical protein
VRNANFSKSLGEIGRDFPRSKQFIAGIVTMVSTNPEWGDTVHGDGEDIRMLTSRSGKGMLPVAVFYKYDAKIVELLGISLTDSAG